MIKGGVGGEGCFRRPAGGLCSRLRRHQGGCLRLRCDTLGVRRIGCESRGGNLTPARHRPLSLGLGGGSVRHASRGDGVGGRGVGGRGVGGRGVGGDRGGANGGGAYGGGANFRLAPGRRCRPRRPCAKQLLSSLPSQPAARVPLEMHSGGLLLGGALPRLLLRLRLQRSDTARLLHHRRTARARPPLILNPRHLTPPRHPPAAPRAAALAAHGRAPGFRPVPPL